MWQDHRRAQSVSAPTAALVLPQGTPPAVMTGSGTPVRSALDRHGLSAFMMPRNAALAHKARHAVVATHEGGTIRGVTIFSRSMCAIELWGGQCMDAAKLDDHPERSDEEYRAYAQRLWNKQVGRSAWHPARQPRAVPKISRQLHPRRCAKQTGRTSAKKCDALGRSQCLAKWCIQLLRRKKDPLSVC